MTIPTNVSTYYTVTISAVSNSAPVSFTVRAVPVGAQASEPCGTLTINQAGQKTASGTGRCW
jgi:type IV pilus assembly protein PilE